MKHARFRRATATAALVFCFACSGTSARAGDDAPDDLSVYWPGASQASEQVGWIRKNDNADIEAPYALVDSAGMLRCYLRPTGAIGLDRYVNRKVHVRGDESRIPGESARLLEVSSIGPPDGPAKFMTPPKRGSATAQNQFDRAVRPASFDGNDQPFPIEDIPTPAGPARSRMQSSSTGAMPQTSMPSTNMGPTPDGSTTMVPEETGGILSDHPHDDGEVWDDGGAGCGPSCSTCGGCGHASCSSCCHGCCWPPGRLWVRAEYLYWWTDSMRVPPLVTTGPIGGANPGALGENGTEVLYGGSRVDGYGRSGGRLTVGTWLTPCQTVGLEGEYFALGTATSSFSATSAGNPILARPFYDTELNPNTQQLVGQNAEQVASPGVLAGTVSACTYTKLQGAGAWLRFNLCCKQRCVDNCYCPCLSGPTGSRLDFLAGYRYLNLSDGVAVTENLTSLVSGAPGAFVVNDSFTTRNQFNGADFGFAWSGYRGPRWSLELISRLGMGNNNETVTINGSTVTTVNGASTTSSGGLLAQSTNIGRYNRNQFAVIPQLGANLGYWLTPRLRLIFGYTFIYWSQVVRAGDQIDTNVNSTLLPNSGVAATGDVRHPAFTWQSTDFWAQGINVGLDYRF